MVTGYKNKDYKEFLAHKKDLICWTFDRGKHNNLRTVRFVLDTFEGIYTQVKAMKQLTPAQRENFLERYLFFLSTYSIKYKEGASENDLKTLENISSDLLTPAMGRSTRLNEIFQQQQQEQEDQGTSQAPIEKSFIDKFEEQFINEYGESNFEYFSFLATYIHTSAVVIMGIADLVHITLTCTRNDPSV